MFSSYSPGDGDPPFVDDIRVLVSAPAGAVWQALATQLGRSFSGSGPLARLLGTEPWRTSGTPLAEGATLPGFAVAEAVPGRHARLTGHHRFSRYSWVFTLDERPDGTLLSARTYAGFPGLHGWAYRALVIGSGAHRVAVTRMLRAVRQRAERAVAAA